MEITVDRIIGTDVYSIEKGCRLGQVRRFLLDPLKKELIALTVADRSRFKEETILYLADVVGLSSAAVTVSSPEVLRKKSDCPQLKDLLKSPPDIFGLAVIKADGSYLGKAASYCIDTETGAVTEIELAPERQKGCRRGIRLSLAVEDIKIIGTDMILAADSAEISYLDTEEAAKKIKREKIPVFPKGCGEKITALSDKMLHRKDAVIFPEIAADNGESAAEEPSSHS